MSGEYKEKIENIVKNWCESFPDGFDAMIFKELKLESCERGAIEFSMVVPMHLCNIIPTLHGGAIASIVDITSSCAILSAEEGINPSVSVEISTHYASTAKLGEKIRIKSSVYKMGKNLAYTDTSIINSRGDIVCKGSHTKYVAFKPKSKL